MDRDKMLVWFPFILVSLEAGIYLSNDMYLPALPDIAKSFAISQDMAQYTLASWFVGSATLQLFMGPISDKFGRRPCLIVGALVFALASLLCAMTTSFTIMLIARFFQGTTVCVAVVAGYAAIHELFDTKKAMKILALMGSISILAPAAGPIAGALVIKFSEWEVIFWILGIWGLLSATAIILWAQESRPEPKPLHLKTIFTNYKKIICNKKFLSYILPLDFAMLGFMAWMVESPFIIIESYGHSQLTFGLVQFFIFAAFIASSRYMLPKLLDSIGPYYLIRTGLSISTVGVICAVLSSIFTDGNIYTLTISLMITSYGLALIFGPSNRLAIDASSEPMGARVAMFSFCLTFFSVIGMFIITLANNGTFLNLSLVIAGGTITALLCALALQTKEDDYTSDEQAPMH